MTEEIIVVRDHTKPCEHGSLWAHWITVKNAKWWQEPECLGGRGMTLRQLKDGLWQQIDEIPPVENN